MMFENYPDILSIADIATILSIGKSSAYKLVRTNALRHLRIGKSIKIPKMHLLDFIANSCYDNGVVVNSPSQKEVLSNDG